jgi:uncharacterized membrane protein
MWPSILGISVFQHCRPYIKKHITTTLTDCEFLLLNSLLIASIVVFYGFFHKNESFSNISGMSLFQLMCWALFSLITVFTSLEIYKLESYDIISTNVLLKSVSFILFVVLGVVVFNEEVTYRQGLGIFLIAFGLYLSSNK